MILARTTEKEHNMAMTRQVCLESSTDQEHNLALSGQLCLWQVNNRMALSSFPHPPTFPPISLSLSPPLSLILVEQRREGGLYPPTVLFTKHRMQCRATGLLDSQTALEVKPPGDFLSPSLPTRLPSLHACSRYLSPHHSLLYYL